MLRLLNNEVCLPSDFVMLILTLLVTASLAAATPRTDAVHSDSFCKMEALLDSNFGQLDKDLRDVRTSLDDYHTFETSIPSGTSPEKVHTRIDYFLTILVRTPFQNEPVTLLIVHV